MDSRVERFYAGTQQWFRKIALGRTKLIDFLAGAMIRRSKPAVVAITTALQTISTVTVAAFLLCAPLYPQGNAGRILGVVTDQQGAAALAQIVDFAGFKLTAAQAAFQMRHFRLNCS